MITSSEVHNLDRAVEEAILGGADVVQFRDKVARDPDFTAQAERLLKITRRYRVPFIVNDRLALVRQIGADGVHLGQEDASLAVGRQMLGDQAIIGRSTHNPEQARRAEKEGHDYIGVGPVFETPTKPGVTAVGLDLVRYAVNHISIPFVAIGGINEHNIQQVRECGASTVAVVRAVLGASDPKKAAGKLISGEKK